MRVSKIIKVVEPEKDDRWRGGLYDVYFEHMPEQRVVMTEAHYKMVKFEDELLAKGILPEDIERHRELVEEYCADETSREGESF